MAMYKYTCYMYMSSSTCRYCQGMYTYYTSIYCIVGNMAGFSDPINISHVTGHVCTSVHSESVYSHWNVAIEFVGVGAGPAGLVLAGPLFNDLMIFIIGEREQASIFNDTTVTFYASSNCTCPQLNYIYAVGSLTHSTSKI